MDTKKATLCFIAVMVLVVVVWDVAVLIEPTPGDTISAQFLRLGWNHPFLPCFFGVLGGHLFWPMESSEKYSFFNRIIGLNTQQPA